MGETGLVSTLYGVPSQRTLKRGHRTIRYHPHSTLRVSLRTGIRKSEDHKDAAVVTKKKPQNLIRFKKVLEI